MRKIYFAIVLIIVIILAGCSSSKNYNEDFKKTKDEIAGQGLLCSVVLERYASTWSDAIKYNKDFQVEVGKYKDSLKQSGQYDKFQNEKAKIDSEMKKFTNPPKEYKQAHDKLVELYGIYCQMYSLVMQPSGSLYTFNSTRNDLYSKLIKTSNETNALIPAK